MSEGFPESGNAEQGGGGIDREGAREGEREDRELPGQNSMSGLLLCAGMGLDVEGGNLQPMTFVQAPSLLKTLFSTGKSSVFREGKPKKGEVASLHFPPHGLLSGAIRKVGV